MVTMSEIYAVLKLKKLLNDSFIDLLKVRSLDDLKVLGEDKFNQAKDILKDHPALLKELMKGL